jgi:hypothetical protein
VEVPTEKIREVSRLGDPIGNGIARGMGIGALAGLPIMLMGDRSAYPSESTMPLALGLSLYGAGIGAALGAVFDAAFERRFVVFRTQVQGVSVVPILARDRTGLAVTWRF